MARRPRTPRSMSSPGTHHSLGAPPTASATTAFAAPRIAAWHACVDTMPVRLCDSSLECSSSFLQRHTVPCWRPWGCERLDLVLHLDGGRLWFAGASACAALDRCGEVVPSVASTHGVKRHPDQLHEIADASSELEGHREERSTAPHAARGRAVRTDVRRHHAPRDRAA